MCKNNIFKTSKKILHIWDVAVGGCGGFCGGTSGGGSTGQGVRGVALGVFFINIHMTPLQ